MKASPAAAMRAPPVEGGPPADATGGRPAGAPPGRPARRRSRLVPALLFALGACVDLQPIEGDTCGNGVVEGGEDCDFAEPGCRRPPAAGACRYECVHPSVGEGAGCPEGFGCGVDNTCRRSAGTFARTIERLSEGASALRVADFDGDGRDDVLALGAPNAYGERSARVVFRDGGGFGATTRLPNVFRAAAVGSLVPGLGPARGLALVSRQGAQAALNLLVGGPDRGFASVVSPALASAALPASMRLVGVEALPRRAVAGEGGATVEFNQGDEVVLLQPDLLGRGAGLFGLVSSPRELPPNASNPDPDVVALLTLGVSPVDAEGGVAVGRFSAPGVGAPCEDIVWAPRELAEAYLLSPCRVDAPPDAPPGAGAVAFWNEEGIAGRVEPRRVPLPGGASPAAGAARWTFVADANADGVSDLAVMTERGVAFAPGRPDGAAPVAELMDRVGWPTRKLLAFGELNGDGAPDWVFADGIVLSEAGLPAGVTREPSAAPWSEALVADFNGDGLSDVLAVGPASNSLDYYLDTSGGFFNALSVPVAGVPSRLAAGDFDGDGVADVAFAMVDEVADGVEVDAVFIAFGGKAALPAAPVRVGALSGVRQITAGSYVFGGSGLDGADDLGLVGALGPDGSALVALLFGNVARQPLSPLIITGDPSLRPWAVATGSFFADIDDKPQPGLALLAGENDVAGLPYSFWLSSPAGGVTLFPPPEGDAQGAPGTTLPPEVEPAPRHRDPVSYEKGDLPQLLAADLDGDDIDEAVAWMPQPGGACLVFARAETGPSGARVLVADRVLEGLPRSTLAGFADVDGDGRPDLVSVSPLQGGEVPNLIIFWNADGDFDPARATRVEVPGGARSWAAPAKPSGVRLFAVSAQGAYAIDARPLGEPRVDEILDDGGEAIAAGDVTGDGVVDLVVGDGQSLRLARGEPVLP